MSATIDFTLPLRLIARFLIPIGLIGQATEFTNIEYQNNDGRDLYAYLAKPPDFDKTKIYPTAIVLHAWNGMSNEPVYFADLLAEQGYIAIAPDLFRNIATCEANLPWNILNTLLTPQDRMDQDVDAAIDYLINEVGNVDESKIFSGPGFCFGGSQALELSSRRAVAGTITLYGANIDGFQDPTDDDRWGLLGVDGTPVLGIYGADDNAPSPEEARGFEAAMNTRNITNTVTIYDGVGHAFVNPEDHASGQNQAVSAWDQVVAWMNDIVQDSTAASRQTRDISVILPRSHTFGPSFRMLFDHAMDLFQRKGHFDHLSNSIDSRDHSLRGIVGSQLRRKQEDFVRVINQPALIDTKP